MAEPTPDAMRLAFDRLLCRRGPTPGDPPQAGTNQYITWRHRNTTAAKSALLRGDNEVLFDNTDHLTESEQRTVCDGLTEAQLSRTLFEKSWLTVDYDVGVDEPDERPLYLDNRGWRDHREYRGFALKFVRTIGEGGFGQVSLWRATFEDSSEQLVVIKCPSNPAASVDSLEKENYFHKRYAGAAHVVQRADLHAAATRIRGNIGWGDWRYHSNRVEPELEGVLVLEYAQHGDLCDVLQKAFQNPDITRHRRHPFTRKRLWELWQCCESFFSIFILHACTNVGASDTDDVAFSFLLVATGVASFSYHPKPWSSNINPDDLMHTVGGLAALSRRVDTHDVHFDIEEQNSELS